MLETLDFTIPIGSAPTFYISICILTLLSLLFTKRRFEEVTMLRVTSFVLRMLLGLEIIPIFFVLHEDLGLSLSGFPLAVRCHVRDFSIV